MIALAFALNLMLEVQRAALTPFLLRAWEFRP